MWTHIDYPVELRDLVVVGWKGLRVRSFTIRPRLGGHYRFCLWPSRFPESGWVVRHDLHFPGEGSAPVHVRFDLDAQRARGFEEWSWALVRLADERAWLPDSELLFGDRSIASGRVVFPGRLPPSEVRTIVWSCHQPFEDEDGRAVLHPSTTRIMPWYEQMVGAFRPDVIWGAGDTAYSDAKPPTNFADRVYNRQGWHLSAEGRQWLRDAYARMYRYHWSLPAMQSVMGTWPHLFMWDDHEIRDGWGSEEADFRDGNAAMFDVARAVADEYILNAGPRLREDGDAHQAYVTGSQANFVFDGRSSRNYGGGHGQIISPGQMEDFRRFLARVSTHRAVEYLFIGSAVPLIYLKSILVRLGSEAPKFLTDAAAGVRDDLRDSWDSPGNRDALKALLATLRDFQFGRPDVQIAILAGDVHVANAFEIWPPGFVRPFYHITSSAITNRDHVPDLVSLLGQLDRIETHPDLGAIRRLWPEISDPNVLCVRTTPGRAEFTLRVLPLDNSAARDQVLVLD